MFPEFPEPRIKMHQRFAEIAEIIGFEQALKLSQKLGGTSTQIPRGVVLPDFEDILGREDATTLCRHFEGDRFSIPKADFIYRQQRNQQIISSFYGGDNVRTLALRWRLSQRRIATILAESR